MKILIDVYMDGGTVKVTYDSKEVFIDRRLGTSTPFKVYNTYPNKPEAQVIEDTSEIVKLLQQVPSDNLYYDLVQLVLRTMR